VEWNTASVPLAVRSQNTGTDPIFDRDRTRMSASSDHAWTEPTCRLNYRRSRPLDRTIRVEAHQPRCATGRFAGDKTRPSQNRSLALNRRTETVPTVCSSAFWRLNCVINMPYGRWLSPN
jgi:hypothetical protein